MLLSERLYFCFHSAALDGVPVTMPESLQLRVLSRAGAIWLLERLPSPHNATPSLRVGSDAGQQRGSGECGGLCKELAARVLGHGDTSLRALADNSARESSRVCEEFFATAWNRGPQGRYPCLLRNMSGDLGMSRDWTNLMAVKGFFLAPVMLILAACTAGNGEGLDQNGQPIPIVPPV